MLVFDQIRKSDQPLRHLAMTMLAGMIILFIGLWHVQVFSSQRYRYSQENQVYRTVRTPGLRGKILDQNRLPLAENRPSYDLVLYLDELRPLFYYEYTNHVRPKWRAENPKAPLNYSTRLVLQRESRYRAASNLVHRLGSVLQQPLVLDSNRFHDHHIKSPALPLPILEDLNPGQIARVLEYRANPPGVDIEAHPVRHYPNSNVAAHVVGHLQRDNTSGPDEEAFVNYRLPDFKGVIGIEGAFDRELRGRAGVKSVLVNSSGYRELETTWTPAEPGRNVILTLDLPLQKATEEALRSAIANVHGAAVVLDSRNGNVLAMASMPSFDPNSFLTLLSVGQRGCPRTEWARLQDRTHRPLINRATYDHYPPGSIFKIIVGLAGLESGVLNPAEVIQTEGAYRWASWARPINDTAPAGLYDFRRAFIKSSNYYFVDYGLRMGIDRILEMAGRFHFGERTGIPLNQETPGLLLRSPDEKRRFYPNEPWTRGDTANISIGQGLLDVTPLQAALMVAAIANGGKVFKPRLVHAIEPQDSLYAESTQIFPVELRSEIAVSERTLRILKEAMLADVEDPEGTAYTPFHDRGGKHLVPGMRIGGKTGTAQKRSRSREYVTWFASFGYSESTTPAGTVQGPAYVVIVRVDGGASGGGSCAPAARKIYQALQKREQMGRNPVL